MGSWTWRMGQRVHSEKTAFSSLHDSFFVCLCVCMHSIQIPNHVYPECVSLLYLVFIKVWGITFYDNAAICRWSWRWSQKNIENCVCETFNMRSIVWNFFFFFFFVWVSVCSGSLRYSALLPHRSGISVRSRAVWTEREKVSQWGYSYTPSIDKRDEGREGKWERKSTGDQTEIVEA